MSVQAVGAVIKQAKVDSPGEYVVLLMLADRADEIGRCWPSLTRLAVDSRMTVRGVQKVLRTLEAKGQISTALQKGPRGVNLYTIHPKGGVNSVQGGERRTPKGGEPPFTQNHQEPSINREETKRKFKEIITRLENGKRT